MTTKLAINLNALKTAALFVSPDELRYYLNGVLIEATPGQVVYASTDGHRLFARREGVNNGGDQWTGNIIIPTAICEALKFGKRDFEGDIMPGVLSPAGEKDFLLEAPATGRQGVKFAPIDGTFPDWRKVVPSDLSGEVAQFNGEYLASFHKAHKMLGGGGMVKIGHNGDGPAIVDFGPTMPDTFGVVMPFRSKKQSGIQVPTWIW